MLLNAQDTVLSKVIIKNIETFGQDTTILNVIVLETDNWFIDEDSSVVVGITSGRLSELKLISVDLETTANLNDTCFVLYTKNHTINQLIEISTQGDFSVIRNKLINLPLPSESNRAINEKE